MAKTKKKNMKKTEELDVVVPYKRYHDEIKSIELAKKVISDIKDGEEVFYINEIQGTHFNPPITAVVINKSEAFTSLQNEINELKTKLSEANNTLIKNRTLKKDLIDSQRLNKLYEKEIDSLKPKNKSWWNIF